MSSYKKVLHMPALFGTLLLFRHGKSGAVSGASAARGRANLAEHGLTGLPDGPLFGEVWPRLKTLVRSGLALSLGLVLGGCANLSPQTMSWKEEVKLHDGRVIVAERFYNLGGYPGYDATERVPLDETVTFHLPDGSIIIWKNDFRDSVPEPNSLNHFRFDLVGGVPYLATYPAGCIAYNKWGRPNPPQVLLRYTKGKWQRVALDELPPRLINADANVVVGRPATSLLKGFYTVQDVEAKNRNIKTPEYKTVLRDPVTRGAAITTCESLIQYKCGWGAPGELNRKYFDRVCK